MENLTFRKYGLSPRDVEYYKNMGILPDKRTLKNLVQSYNSRYLLDATDVSVLEEKIGYKLDKNYVAFLLKYNGGVPSKNVIKGENIVIDHFLSFKSDYKFNSLIDLYQEFDLYGLPIARTPSGDTILLDSDGKIYLYSHDIDGINSDKGVLANSFIELLHRLT